MLQEYNFGKWPIAESEVFATSKFAFAFVNLKPLVPGEMHHLISRHLSACRRLLARILLISELIIGQLHSQATCWWRRAELSRALATCLARRSQTFGEVHHRDRSHH